MEIGVIDHPVECKADTQEYGETQISVDVVDDSLCGADIFGTQALDSVGGVDILNNSYRLDVKRTLFLWGVLLAVVTVLLIIGFFGCFRRLRGDALDLNQNLWNEDLFWTSMTIFIVSCLAVIAGFSALISHTNLESHRKIIWFQRLFKWCLTLHAFAAIISLLVAIKLTTVDLLAREFFSNFSEEQQAINAFSELDATSNTFNRNSMPRLRPYHHESVMFIPSLSTISSALKTAPSLRAYSRFSNASNASDQSEKVSEHPAFHSNEDDLNAAPSFSQKSPTAISLQAIHEHVTLSKKILNANPCKSFLPQGAYIELNDKLNLDRVHRKKALGSSEMQRHISGLESSEERISSPALLILKSSDQQNLLTQKAFPNKTITAALPHISSFPEVSDSRGPEQSVEKQNGDLQTMRESPTYKRILYASVALEYFVAVLHAVCFICSWRLAAKLGKLFGLKIPIMPF